MSFLLLGACAAPATPVEAPERRLLAEWEPALGTLVVFPFDLPDQLVVDLANEATLFVLVAESHRDVAQRQLAGLGVPLDRCRLLRTEARSPWTRDWGPHQVATGRGERWLVDHVFRGYPWVPAKCTADDIGYHFGSMAGEDDAVAELGRELTIPTIPLPVIATGGNLLTDGHGRAFCTEAQLVENVDVDAATYRATLREHLGITDLVVLENTEPFGIQHIDCWFKVLDPETLLVKRAPVDHPEHAPIERNVERLRALRSPSGAAYRILRIDCPPFRGDDLPAYTNSLLLNGVVHVPLFGGVADERALATYREALPDCEVRGYRHPTWRHFDALHCRTRALFAAPRDARGAGRPGGG